MGRLKVDSTGAWKAAWMVESMAAMKVDYLVLVRVGMKAETKVG